jgi:L-malate glycosyltransferase
MEILFVSHKHPPTTGGMEKQSFELVNGMKQLCQVHELIYKGVGTRINFFLTLNNQIKAILINNPQIDTIHFNDALIASFYLLFCHKHPIKHAVTLHGLDVVFPSWIFQKFVLKRLNNFDIIFAVSQATADAAINLGLDRAKVLVISNGVDENIKQFKFSPNFYDDFQQKYHLDIRDKQLLIAMGRPVKRKGFSWFIENVMPKLEHDFLILFIGPFHWKKTKLEKILQFFPAFLKNKIELFLGLPSDEPKLRLLLNQPTIRKRAKHLGRLPFDDVLNILHHAKAFIMPNIEVPGDMEGFGLVCLEASLCRTLVYASSTGGIPDAVKDGLNGYLIPPQNLNVWAESLNNVMQMQNSTIKEVAANFSDYTSNHYGWKKMVKAYYDKLNSSAKID